MGRFPWLKKSASSKSEAVTATGGLAVPVQDADGKAGRRGFGAREVAKAPQAMDIDDDQERRDSLSNLSDDSAFSVEHGHGVRRDTSGSHQHYREASIAAAAAAAAAAVQQHQQKQQQLLAQEHRLAELMQSGDQAPSGRMPPGAPTSITADARGASSAASSRAAGRPPHQREQQPPQQPQPQQPVGAAGPANAEDEPLRNHPHYRMLREVNRGTHGFVQLALDTRTSTRMAIKFIPRDQKMQTKSVLRELVNQRLYLTHPYIITLHEVFLTPKHLCIAMEYADGGDLTQFVCNYVTHLGSPLPEHIARQLFQQLIIAVDYCHRLGIVNRDIKLDNMLLHNAGQSEMLKLCDFGYSKDDGLGTEASGCKTACGTPEYMAPEVMLGRVYDGRMVDVWSTGCSLFVMLAGAFPFLQATQENLSPVERMRVMFPRLVAGTYNPLPPTVSHAAADLISRMLQPNPALRITIQGIMQHPWFLKDIQPDMLELNDRLLVTSPRTAARRGAIAAARRGQEQVAASGIRGQSLEELVALVKSCITSRDSIAAAAPRDSSAAAQ